MHQRRGIWKRQEPAEQPSQTNSYTQVLWTWALSSEHTNGSTEVSAFVHVVFTS